MRIDTDVRATHMARTASAAFVPRSASRTHLYTNSQCKQERQFDDDYSIVLVILSFMYLTELLINHYRWKGVFLITIAALANISFCSLKFKNKNENILCLKLIDGMSNCQIRKIHMNVVP